MKGGGGRRQVVLYHGIVMTLGGNYEVYNIILKRKKSQEEGRERKN